MLSVSELNEQIKASLEINFEDILVEGEVSSATYHSSGHLYFSIKDDKSTLKCVMWRSNVARMRFQISPGEHIIVNGSIGVYVPRGDYQLIAKKIEPFGQGALALAFEQLKKKLEAKGYFDESRKKEIPKFIKKLAVVTALNSAAFEDILKIAKKRWPLLEIVAIDTLVQGDGAAYEIARAIKYADTLNCDAILVSRGGGSKEDLWAFNEEIVADAIFEAKTPVISAIGHEIDFLISDFVADLRAPTPSGAMEHILPNKDDYLFLLDDLKEKFNSTINIKISDSENILKHLQKQFLLLNPSKKIDYYLNEFNSLKTMLNDIMKHKFLKLDKKINPLKEQLSRNLSYKISQKETLLEPLKDSLKRQIEHILIKKANSLEALKEQIKLYEPSKRLKEGFVEVVKDGKRVDICYLEKNDEVELVSSKCKVKVKLISDKSYF